MFSIEGSDDILQGTFIPSDVTSFI
jgi:hypothetical protein